MFGLKKKLKYFMLRLKIQAALFICIYDTSCWSGLSLTNIKHSNLRLEGSCQLPFDSSAPGGTESSGDGESEYPRCCWRSACQR